ncbi:MAG: Cell division protein ZapB [Deltaproteobacteria bacterium]|nr:Cell division protein ZapB [Deltaproteobacteria bacterium]
MSNDLLKQLEEKITAAIETIELSRIEISDLKDQNEELENRYVDWEARLSALIEKFEQLEEGEAVEEVEEEVKAAIDEVEDESEEEDEAVEFVEAVEAGEADDAEDAEEDSEEDEELGSTFDTSADAYTDAPESARHYA